MAGSITAYETASGKRYRVRYRKPDKSQTDKRGFRTKKDAELFLASVTMSKATGEYVDPSKARITVGQLHQRWLDGKKVLKPSAYDSLPRAWRNQVEPTWAHREIGSIEKSEVQAWVASLYADRSASTVLRALGVLAGILDMAIDDGYIKRNPARGLTNRPRKPKKKPGRVYLTHQQLELLARCSKRPTLVRVLGVTGLRWGEAAALMVRGHDQVRRRLHAELNAPTVNGVVIVGPLKTWEDRWVPYPEYLEAEIHALCAGRAPTALMFPDDYGQHLRRPDHGTGWFEGAVKRAQKIDPSIPRITVHDLRHTAASLAISAGANVKALQRMLGHESAAITLDRYADLFDDDLESVAVKLAAARDAAGFPAAWARRLDEPAA
jgi:integrase